MAASADDMLGYFRAENTREDSNQHHVIASGRSARSGSVASFFAYIYQAKCRCLDADARANLKIFEKFMQLKTGSSHEQITEKRCHASCGEPMAIAKALYSGEAPEDIVLNSITHIGTGETRPPCQDYCQDYIVRGTVRGQWKVNWTHIEEAVEQHKHEMRQATAASKARQEQQRKAQERRDEEAAKAKAVRQNPFSFLTVEED